MSATTSAPLARIEQISGEFHVDTLRSEDGSLDLRYGVRYPGAAEPERYVVFANGRSEWLEKYSYVAEDLRLPEGTAFLSWDHRGQGASGGLRSYVDSYESYASDAAQIVRHVTKGKPYVLIAHSMGALITLYATLTGRLDPAAMVLCSPLLGLPDAPVPRKYARPLARALTALRLGPLSTSGGQFGVTPFEGNDLTHNPELYRRICASPYKIPGATFGWVKATFDAIDVVFDPARLARRTAPALVVGAGGETVVDPAALGRWVQAAGKASPAEAQLRIFPGARHELLSELPQYYDATLATIRAFLEPRWP